MTERAETNFHRVWRALNEAGAPLTAKQILSRAGYDDLEFLRAIIWQVVRAGYVERLDTKPQTYSPLAEPPQPGPGPRRSVVKLQIATLRAALAGDAAARAEVVAAIGGEA